MFVVVVGVVCVVVVVVVVVGVCLEWLVSSCVCPAGLHVLREGGRGEPAQHRLQLKRRRTTTEEADGVVKSGLLIPPTARAAKLN